MSSARPQPVDKQAFVSELVAAWNTRPLDALGELYASDAALHHPMHAEPIVGREAIVALEEHVTDGLTELSWDVVWALHDGDLIAVEFAASAKHTGPLQMQGHILEPTNQRVHASGAMLFRLGADGLVAEEHRFFDNLGVLRQLGLAPGTGPSPV